MKPAAAEADAHSVSNSAKKSTPSWHIFARIQQWNMHLHAAAALSVEKVQSALLLIADVKMILGDRIENDAGNENKIPVDGTNGKEEGNKKQNNACNNNSEWMYELAFDDALFCDQIRFFVNARLST